MSSEMTSYGATDLEWSGGRPNGPTHEPLRAKKSKTFKLRHLLVAGFLLVALGTAVHISSTNDVAEHGVEEKAALEKSRNIVRLEKERNFAVRADALKVSNSEKRQVADDTDEIESPNRGWVLMVRQSLQFLFTKTIAENGQYNADNPNADNYCNLASLYRYRQNATNGTTTGKFLFKIVWPGSDLQAQVWKQTSNPWTRRSPNNVMGYEPVSSPHTTGMWGGLEWNGEKSILDGSTSDGDWFYSIGSFQMDQGGILGPSKAVQEAELWVKPVGGFDFNPNPAPRPPRFTTIVTPPQSLPCPVMAQGMCDLSPKCSATPISCKCIISAAHVLIAMDPSLHTGSAGFEFEKLLIETMLITLSETARAGVILSGNSPTIVANLSSSLDDTRKLVRNVSYPDADVLNLGGSIELALGPLFFGGGMSGSLQLVLFVSGKNSGVNPCTFSSQLRNRPGLNVIVIAVGNKYSVPTILCLARSRQFIVHADSFNLVHFAKAWPKIDSLLCPDVVSENLDTFVPTTSPTKNPTTRR